MMSKESIQLLRLLAVFLVLIGGYTFGQSTVELKLQNLVTDLQTCVQSKEFKDLMIDLGMDEDNRISESLDEVEESLESTDLSDQEEELVKFHTSLKEQFETPPSKGVVSLCELLGYSIDLDGNNTDRQLSDPERSGTQDAEPEKVVKNYLEQLTGKTDTTIKAEIKALNQKNLGEFGASLVKSGVDQDWDAYQELKKSKYKAYEDIVKTNIKNLGDYGWSLVKSGVDQDIEAQKALDDF